MFHPTSCPLLEMTIWVNLLSLGYLRRLSICSFFCLVSCTSPRLKRAPLSGDCVVSVSSRHFRAVSTCSGDGPSCELSSSVVTVALLQTKMVPFHALDSSSAQARTGVHVVLTPAGRRHVNNGQVFLTLPPPPTLRPQYLQHPHSKNVVAHNNINYLFCQRILHQKEFLLLIRLLTFINTAKIDGRTGIWYTE